MADMKIMIIAVVAVVAVAGAGAFVLLGNNGGSKSTEDIDALGLVYGNANGDAEINSSDLQIIQDIMDGNKVLKDYPLADANRDNEVNEADYSIVQQFIDGDKVQLYVMDTIGGISKVEYPLKGIFAAGGTNMRVLIEVLDMEPHLAANATNDYISPVLDKKLYEARESGAIAKVTTGATHADWSELGKRAGTYSLALIEDAGTSGYANEAGRSTFKDMGVDVLQFSADNYVSLKKAAATLGILIGSEAQAKSFISLLDNVVDTISTKLGDKMGTETVMCITMSNSVSGYESDYFNATELAGGKNIADWPDKTRKFDPAEDQWLFEEKYNPNNLFHFKSMTYGDTPTKTEISGYVHYFDKTAAYKSEHYYLINGAVPLPVRIAYMATIMYPDTFEAGWYMSVFQDYVDKFVDNSDLDVDDYKVFWNTAELKEFLK
ncbi:MAG: hypothetical protein E7Z63_06480 [Thermoplasmata archaeon]|nr:hypothetical protein [Thermoplasmata archaeon]